MPGVFTDTEESKRSGHLEVAAVFDNLGMKSAIFSTVPPCQGLVHGPLINAFNKWTKQDPARELIRDFDHQIKPMYQGVIPGPPENINISFCQHPELTLALHHIDQRLNKECGR
ncbi:MAG: hypothetical protein HETSPECPRED_009393 [Heterodermia speciosa]|uniref:Uncharacterized protein n=1 Tax=Heterodermia speciosa TaxID=116794 RepID=A0A8H3IZC9_9LECA|nr:MAG: hypothetical protein HETSPECPRED_009393 [Heterodermia speciosa]